MGKLARYFWPRCGFLFYVAQDRIETAFGFFEKRVLHIQSRQSFPLKQKEDFFDWYRQIRQTYPRLYAVSMIETLNQGALPGCSPRIFEKFGVDEALSRYLCIQKSWSAYVSLVETKWYEEKFKAIELDLLYSPFVLLYRHVHSKLDEVPGLYILHHNGLLYMMVLTRDRLWFAHASAVPRGNEESPVEAGVDVDETDDLAFDLDLLEEEESVEAAADEALSLLDKEENGSEEEGVEDLALLEYNLNLYEEVKEAITRYYRDNRYEETFIQKVMLCDSDGNVNDFPRYVEEELFMPATLERFDPIDVMADLAAGEVG